MTLRCKISITGKYRGKSKFGFWKNLEVGHVIEVEMPLKKSGRGRSGLYATRIKLINLDVTSSFETTVNDLCTYLDKVEYEVLD